jgi:hypothetical protein
MSIFDVIKYPISIPPKREELEALPVDLLVEWMSAAGFADPDYSDPSLLISRALAYYNCWVNSKNTIPINGPMLLRKMIRDLP